MIRLAISRREMAWLCYCLWCTGRFRAARKMKGTRLHKIWTLMHYWRGLDDQDYTIIVDDDRFAAMMKDREGYA
jgi:hypothetical protein